MSIYFIVYLLSNHVNIMPFVTTLWRCVLTLSLLLQSAFLSWPWTGPLFCRALTSQKQRYIWCQTYSMRPVPSSTLTTEMSTCAASSLGPSTPFLWCWLWQLPSHLALGQARPLAIRWPLRYWPTKDLPVTRPSVRSPLPVATSVIKPSHLPRLSGNMSSSVSATRHGATNYCCGSGQLQCRVNLTVPISVRSA